MTLSLMAVLVMLGTTVEILMLPGLMASGVLQLTLMCDGNHVMYHSVVRLAR